MSSCIHSSTVGAWLLGWIAGGVGFTPCPQGRGVELRPLVDPKFRMQMFARKGEACLLVYILQPWEPGSWVG